ncbi:MAG: hypothetical protein K6B54_03070 [Clostridia bacterium]|nr:hypothetical protein [Clostridia bacterium]
MKRKWMRFLLITLSIAVLTVSTAVLTGCAPKFKAIIYEQVSINPEFEFVSKAFLLTNVNEVEHHVQTYRTDESTQPYYEELKTNYGDEFFKKNNLVVLYYFDETISSKITVKGIQYDGETVTVLLSRSVPKYCSQQVKECVIVVETEKNAKIASADYRVN